MTKGAWIPVPLQFGEEDSNETELNNNINQEVALESKWEVEDHKMTGMKARWDSRHKDKLKHFPAHLLFERKPEKRRYIAGNRLQELSELMPMLPDVDTDYHIMATGNGNRQVKSDIVHSFGFGNFIDYVVSKFGNGCVVYISTWSMNLDHAYMLLELLDSGRVGNLHILSDPSIFNRKFEIMAMLKCGMDKFDGNRIMMFRNHSKVLCMSDRNGERFCTVTGSANLSGNPRLENYVVSSHPELYNHFVDNFFEVMFDVIDGNK